MVKEPENGLGSPESWKMWRERNIAKESVKIVQKETCFRREERRGVASSSENTFTVQRKVTFFQNLLKLNGYKLGIFRN